MRKLLLILPMSGALFLSASLLPRIGITDEITMIIVIIATMRTTSATRIITTSTNMKIALGASIGSNITARMSTGIAPVSVNVRITGTGDTITRMLSCRSTFVRLTATSMPVRC